METYKNVYFIGVGGIGMSALARYFNVLGYTVYGYDKTPSPLTDTLIREGVLIHFEDNPNLIIELGLTILDTLVVYTPAIPSDLNEFIYFSDHAFTCLKRAEVLGLITRNSKSVCVAGTHGKTTTSAMLAHILHNSSVGCNAFLGGIATNYDTNYLGSTTSEYTVIEADEFDRSFLQLTPFISIITTTDADHLDIYGNVEEFACGFNAYAHLINEQGALIVRKGITLDSVAHQITYGSELDADFSFINLRFENNFQLMDVYFQGICWTDVHLGLPGLHNAENALACIAVCISIGLTEVEIRDSLRSFKGVKRRFEFHIRRNELVYIDDYAHHPTEINALVNSIKNLYPNKKITMVFQPHLFSRTRDFIDGFAQALSAVDCLYLLPIYPAREKPILGVTSDALFDLIDLKDKHLVPYANLVDVFVVPSEGVLLTVGAGDIDRLVMQLKCKIEETIN